MVKLQITRNGFAMCGLWKPDSYIKTERSKNHFSFCKYNKKSKRKWFFATNNDETFNAREIHPRFCKTDVGGWLYLNFIIPSWYFTINF